nr:hypothetical protein [Desulforamulus aquiferis]
MVKIKHRRTTLQEFLELEEEAKEENLKRFRAPKNKSGYLQKLVIKVRQAGFNKAGEIEIIIAILVSSASCFLLLTTLFSTPYVGAVGIVIGAYLPINYLDGR